MGAEIEYDRQVIQKHVQLLYRQAALAEVWGTTSGGVLGMIAGLVAATPFGEGARIVGLFAGLGLGLLLGYLGGKSRAFRLMLEAQTMLCQAHIAEQTEATSRRVFALVDALSRGGR